MGAREQWSSEGFRGRHSSRARVLAWIAVVGFSLATLTYPGSTAPPAAASSTLTPFECKPLLYQFSDGELFPLDVATNPPGYGSAITITSSSKVAGANGVGWNPADNYVYGESGDTIFRLGIGDAESVTVGGSPLTYSESSTAGDFIADDVLLIGNHTGLNTINVNSGDISDYDLASGATWDPADMTYRDGYVYGMKNNDLYVLRISENQDERTLETFEVTNEDGTAMTLAGSGWGSAYATSGGDFFFYNNLKNNNDGSLSGDGSVWKISASEIQRITDEESPQLKATQVLTKQNLPTANDGFSCPNAQSFDADPVAAPDVYARTTTGSFSVTDPSEALTYGDQAGTSVRLESVTFRGVTVTYSDGSAETIGSFEDGAQLEITNWNTGLFSITNISDATVSFTYTIKETGTVTGQDGPRESEPATVTISALQITDSANNALDTSVNPESIGSFRQFQDAFQYQLYANGDQDETESNNDFFWRAQVVEDGETLRSADSPPSRTLVSDIPGLSLNTRTGVLSGPVTGTTERTEDTIYDVRVWSSFDNQFKTSDSELFTFTVTEPDLFDLTYASNFPDSDLVSGTPPATDTDEAITTVGQFSGLDESCFAFSSWSDGAGNSYSPNDSITLSSDTTLTAQWTDQRVQVTYRANGATGGSAPSDTARYCDGDSASAKGVGTLSRTGFTWTGWSTSDSASTPDYEESDPISIGSSAVTLFATWSAIDYSVTYDGNGATGGSVPTDPNSYNFGDTVTVLGNSGTLTRTGFTFLGWNTQRDGCGQTVSPSGTSTFSMPASNRTLYALWQQPSCRSGGGDRDDRDRRDSRAQPPVMTVNPGALVPRTPRVPTPSPAADSPSPQAEAPRANPPRAEGPSPEPESAPSAPAPTVDSGLGPEQGQPTREALLSSESARRSLAEVSQERLAGFLPSAPITIEVRGARTAARFVTDQEILTNPPLLLEQVALASQSSIDTFFAVQNLALSETPTQPFGPLPEDADTINELFASAGLDQPRTITDTERDALGGSGWIEVQSVVTDYKPGSTVYLVVNSEPLIVGHATVSDTGTAEVSGDIPISWFGIGEHRIRAVGVKQFDGIQVDQNGELVIPDNVLGKIREFDLGTQATILASGPNPDGSSHLAIRVVPLEPDAPWWTLWILAGAFILMLLARIRGILATRSQAIIGGFAVVMSAIPGIVLGWTSTITIVAVWAAILGLAGALLLVIIPARNTDTIRRGA